VLVVGLVAAGRDVAMVVVIVLLEPPHPASAIAAKVSGTVTSSLGRTVLSLVITRISSRGFSCGAVTGAGPFFRVGPKPTGAPSPDCSAPRMIEALWKVEGSLGRAITRA
jgi:hypothetical protein